MTRVVVFDIDDTLYLERDYVLSGLRAVGKWAERRFSVANIFEEAWELFLAGSRRTTISEAFENVQRPLTPSETAEAVSVYRAHMPDIRLCDDAVLLIDSLRGVAKMAVVTDGPAVSQHAKIGVLGISGCARPIVLTAERGIEWHKPGLHGFKMVQSMLEAQPFECVYIADNPAKDFAGPKRLGWSTIRVMRPLGLHAAAEASPGEIDMTVVTLTDLIPTLQST